MEVRNMNKLQSSSGKTQISYTFLIYIIP